MRPSIAAAPTEPLRGPTSFSEAFSEVMADRGRLIALSGRLGLLRQVQQEGASVDEDDVVEWARTLPTRVKGDHPGLSSWAAMVDDFRAWGWHRGSRRVFRP